MADSNIQTLDTVKPITLDEYQERTAHLQENTTSLLSTIADNQVQAASLATQAASLASEVNAVAQQASLSFTKKTWADNATSGTPVTAAELNRLENAISSLTTAVNNLQDSVTPATRVSVSISTTSIQKSSNLWAEAYGSVVSIHLENVKVVKEIDTYLSTQVATIPAGYRPAHYVMGALCQVPNSCVLCVNVSGGVSILARYTKVSIDKVIDGSVTFIAAK